MKDFKRINIHGERKQRTISSTGIYHVSINSHDTVYMFNQDEDFSNFLTILELSRKKQEFVIYTYCLDPKHAHFLIRIPNEAILGNVIMRITTAYLNYLSKKMVIPVPFFRIPFLSEAVETDEIFLAKVRYIHQLPFLKRLISSGNDYPWSSYPLFLDTIKTGKEQTKYSFLDTSFVLGMYEGSDEFLESMK
jgi:putative transposase